MAALNAIRETNDKDPYFKERV